MQWYAKVFRNYANFNNRAHRTEFWMFTLVNFLIGLILGILEVVLHLREVLTNIYSLIVLIPSLAVGARRLHDIGKSGWWQLLGLIPVIGTIILLVFFCIEGEVGANRFGPDPR